MRTFKCIKAVDSKIIRGTGVAFDSGRVAVEWNDNVQSYSDLDQLKKEAEVTMDIISFTTGNGIIPSYNTIPSIGYFPYNATISITTI